MSIEPDNGPVSLVGYEHLRTLPEAQRYRIAMELLLSLGLRGRGGVCAKTGSQRGNRATK